MRDVTRVRTTLDIDEDVLAAAKALARTTGSSAGKVISDLARRALAPAARGRTRNGVPVLSPRRGERPVSPEVVDRLRDD